MKEMAHSQNNKVIMDTVSISFGKQNKLTISKGFAIIVVIVFISCILATALLVYHLSSCTNTHKTQQYIQSLVCNETNDEVSTLNQVEEDASFSTTTPILTTTFPPIPKSNEDVRLPTTVLPDLYEIKLVPFIYEGNFTFQGEVRIVINATAPTDNITLHSDELLIDEPSVRVSRWGGNDTDETISILQIHSDTRKQFLVIHLAETLQPLRQYCIAIKYVGVLNDLLQGFYRCSYRVNNEVRSDLPGYVWDHYQASMPMSTYLVAFAVCDFTSINNGTFSVWARKEAISQANLSLEIGPKLLHFYEDFFDIAFPLPKIDMIALPDFSGGAMENWGLITYRESAMLYDEIVSTRINKQRIAAVIAHELAHQWFGNLVTPKWWSDLWLNEGFATYMEYIGTNAVEPSWRVLDQFVVNEVQSVLALDALKSSHQISVQVSNPNEINDIFDRISYAKGATILRMMEHFLTSDVFKRGLTNYLTKRKYGNADQDDLWQALTEQAHKEGVLEADTSIKDIMDTWTLQTGYPIVFVNRNYQENTVTFTQQRYLLNQQKNETYTPLWWIPITYLDKSNANVNTIWLKVQKSITIHLDTAESDWLLVNYEQYGYYRVNYDVRNWKMLTRQLLDEKDYVKFSPANRAQMLDDSFNLAAAGYIDYDVALNLTQYLHHERDYVPWKAAFTCLDYLQEMFIKTAEFDKLKAYLLSLINGIYIKIGFKESYRDAQITVYNRMEVLWRACLLGHNDCVMNAVTMFQNWRNSPDPDTYNPISPNLKSVVYCTAIRAGGQDEWDFAWKRYVNTNVGSERDLILMALGCTRETWILARYLHWSVSDGSGIRKQDSVRVFAAVSNNVIGQKLAYTFLKTYWDNIKQFTGSSIQLLNSVVRTSTSKFNNREDVEDLKKFFKSNVSLSVAARAFEQSIEQGEANVRWMNKNFNDIVRWLSIFKTAI